MKFLQAGKALKKVNKIEEKVITFAKKKEILAIKNYKKEGIENAYF